MGLFDHAAKDAFASKTQPQNIGRLLVAVVQNVYATLNSPRLLISATEQWTAGDTEERIDRQDLRLFYWQTARECREIILKTLALLYIMEDGALIAQIDSIIELTGSLLDERESVRRRGMEFGEIHWAPIGTAPLPQPPYAMDVAMDVLLCGGKYPRLPVMLESTVKQVGLPDPSAVYQLDSVERRQMQQRIEDEVFAMWVLSKCPKSEAVIKLNCGKILFEVPNEFRITAIFDFQRCQILQAEILVGGLAGLEVSPTINLGFCNVLRQAVGLQEARHKFTIEKIKRQLRELWRGIVELKKQRRMLCDPDTRKVKQLLTVSFIGKDDDGNVGGLVEGQLEPDSTLQTWNNLINIEKKKANRLEQELKDILLFESSVRLKEPIEMVDDANKETSLSSSYRTAAKCFDKPLVRGPPDYFTDFFLLGRWVSGGILLGVLRDQILRAKSCPDVFPGGVFRYIEHCSRGIINETDESTQLPAIGDVERMFLVNSEPGKGEDEKAKSTTSHSITSSKAQTYRERYGSVIRQPRSRFRALDVFFVSQFDHSVGGLLSPLLKVALEYQSLTPFDLDSILINKQGGVDISETEKGDDGQLLSPQGPQLEEFASSRISSSYVRGSTAVTKLPTAQLSGSGAILRYRMDDETGCWSLVLWPLSIVVWLLENSELIRTGHNIDVDNDGVKEETLEEDLMDDVSVSVQVSRNKQEKSEKNLVESTNTGFRASSPLKHSVQHQSLNLGEQLQTLLPYDLNFIRDALQNDSSCEYLRTFDARRLELSAWTRHASSALSALVLSVVAACLSQQTNPTIHADIVDLKTGRNNSVRSPQKISPTTRTKAKTSMPNIDSALSGYRSLTFAYFNQYWIHLHIQPFDGSLRIAFPDDIKTVKQPIPSVSPSSSSSSLPPSTLSSSSLTWIRFPGQFNSSLESELSASFRMCPAGVNGLYRALPYLKFLAFIDLVRQTFINHGLEETEELTDFTDAVHTDQPYSVHRSGRNHYGSQDGSSSVAFWQRDGKIFEKHRSVIITPANESVEFTRTLQKLDHLSQQSGYLEARLTFVVDEWSFSGGRVRVLLSAVLRNDWNLVESFIVVGRMNHSDSEGTASRCLSWSTVASLNVQHPPYRFDCLASNPKSSIFEEYWNLVNTNLRGTSDSLHHIIAIAALSPDEFPFVVRQLNETKDDDNTFLFNCAILKSPQPNWAESTLTWRTDKCIMDNRQEQWTKKLIKQQSLSEIRVLTKTKANGLGVVARVTLTKKLRLPGFCFEGYDFKIFDDNKNRICQLSDETQITFVNVKPLQNGCHRLENVLQKWSPHVKRSPCCNLEAWSNASLHQSAYEWVSCDAMEYQIDAKEDITPDNTRFSKGLADTYRRLFKLVRATAPFIKSILSLQRAELLRKDIAVQQALPNSIKVSWTPWPLRTVGTELSNNYYYIQMSKVHFHWRPLEATKQPESDNNCGDRDAFEELKLSWCIVTIKSHFLKPVLSENKSLIQRWLEENSPSSSSWNLIRLIISTYELHTSMKLLFDSKPSIHELIVGTKLAPLPMMINRISNYPIGSGIISFGPKSPIISPPALGVINEVKLKLDVSIPTSQPTSSATPMTKKTFDEPDLSFLCLTIESRVNTVPQYQSASAIMNFSLNEMLTRLTESLTMTYQSGPTTSSSCFSPALIGLTALDEVSEDRLAASGYTPISHQLYFWPGHLLMDVLLPLLEGVTVWLSGITIAASIDNRLVIERVGALNFARQQPIPKVKDAICTKKGSPIGKLRWRYINSNGEDAIRKAPAVPEGPECTIEIELLPRSGAMLPTQWTANDRYRFHPVEPRDILFSGTASIASCSVLSSNGLFSDLQRYSLWACIWNYLDKIDKKTTSRGLTSIAMKSSLPSVIVSTEPWRWMREFNILLASNSTLLSISVNEQLMPLNESSADLFCCSLVTQWEAMRCQMQTIKSGDTKTQVIDSTDKLHAQSIARSAYLDLVPEALVLPFESCDVNIGQNIETGMSTFGNIQSDLSNDDCEVRSPPSKKLRLNDSTAAPMRSDKTKTEQATLTLAPSSFPPPPEFLSITTWHAPLKPHSILRADKKSLELKFDSGLELVVVPVLTEWNIFAKYFKLFCRQQSVADFLLLVKLLQRGVPSINLIGDLTALLDLVIATGDVHHKHMQQVIKSIMVAQNQKGNNGAAASFNDGTVELPPPSIIPYLQLEFRKPSNNRSRISACLDIDLIVWSSPPFASQLLSGFARSLPNLNVIGLDQYASSAFTLSILMPFPPTDQTPITFNGTLQLGALVEKLNSAVTTTLPPVYPSPPLSVSLQRPISKVLTRIFASGYPFYVLQSAFSTQSNQKDHSPPK